MSMQAPFFGKRPADPAPIRPTPTGPGGLSAATSSSMPHTANAPAPPAPASPLPVLSEASTTAPAATGAPAKEGGSKLTVGPNIKLKGVEITDCDTLVVEGTVEATMDSRVMHITALGAFQGSADVDYAEIHGAFSGDLTVRDKLVIYASGRVSGKIRYGKLVVDEGGQLSGDIQFGASSKTKELPPAKMGTLAAA